MGKDGGGGWKSWRGLDFWLGLGLVLTRTFTPPPQGGRCGIRAGIGQCGSGGTVLCNEQAAVAQVQSALVHYCSVHWQ